MVLGCSVQKRIMHWNYDMAWSQWDISPHLNTSWSTPFLLAYTTSRQQSDCMAAIVQKNWFLIYPLLGFKKSYYFVLDLARRQPSWTFSVGLHKMQMLQNNMREKYYRQLWGIGFVDFLYILTNRANCCTSLCDCKIFQIKKVAVSDISSNHLMSCCWM